MTDTALPAPPPLRYFVRTILGCGCPEDVLEHIELEVRPGPPAWRALRVGGRLLVHVRPAPEPDLAGLEAWLATGVAERDGQGFNRFRLVLVAAEPETLRAAAEARLAAWGGDDRTHVHVIAEDAAQAVGTA